MITGDYHHTAIAVARDVGMINPHAQTVIIDVARQSPPKLILPGQSMTGPYSTAPGLHGMALGLHGTALRHNASATWLGLSPSSHEERPEDVLEAHMSIEAQLSMAQNILEGQVSAAERELRPSGSILAGQLSFGPGQDAFPGLSGNGPAMSSATRQESGRFKMAKAAVSSSAVFSESVASKQKAQKQGSWRKPSSLNLSFSAGEFSMPNSPRSPAKGSMSFSAILDTEQSSSASPLLPIDKHP